MRKLVLLLTCLVLTILSNAQNLPANFNRVTVGGTSAAISNPTAVAFAPDGRIFVAQQNGALRVIKNDVLLSTPFVSLTVNSDGERGLLGIAFDPSFATNNYIYLYYTTATNGLHNRISRFTANGDVAVAGSETIILELDPLSSATNHNGGAIAFGPDGKLYVAIGENANGSYAQNLEIYHGKFLRINKDGTAPSDNPFQQSEHSRRIWSYGLRNPYTFSIHPVSGRIFLNDVGQNTWEEINDATTAGKNFGWPTSEGATTNPAFTGPFYAYRHDTPQPTGCAITGGTFFSPATTNYPSTYSGKYFFMDLCSAWIYYIDPSVTNPTATQFATSIGAQCVGLTTGPDGNLYYLSRSNSRLYRIVYTPPATPPTITSHPQNATITAGQSVTFSVTATGTQPFSYQWQKNTVNINGATQSSFSINNAQLSDAASYRVIVTNVATSVTSNAATLVVNPPPSLPVIQQQPAPVTVEAGQPATLSVLAVGQGTLNYQWYRNGNALSGKTSATLNLTPATQNDAGNYYVTITNTGGTITSNTVALTIVLPNQPPVANIVKPLPTDLYRAGSTISYQATGTDNEDGDLPASAFTWDVHFHHDTHFHDQPAITGVKSGELSIPDRGETSTNVWYRFILTVKDSKGATGRDSVDVHPLKSDLTFLTQPPGLQILLDGSPVTTPLTISSVEGFKRDVDVQTEQKMLDDNYLFSAWSMGGSQSQTITTPADNTTYTATFSVVTGDLQNALDSKVYPNPASTLLYIADPDVRAAKLVNSIGKAIELTAVNHSLYSVVDVSAIPTGVFVLSYTTSDGEHKVKIVLSR